MQPPPDIFITITHGRPEQESAAAGAVNRCAMEPGQADMAAAVAAPLLPLVGVVGEALPPVPEVRVGGFEQRETHHAARGEAAQAGLQTEVHLFVEVHGATDADPAVALAALRRYLAGRLAE